VQAGFIDKKKHQETSQPLILEVIKLGSTGREPAKSKKENAQKMFLKSNGSFAK
jgi:hypothetical protein